MGKFLFRLRTEAFRRQAGRCDYCSVSMWAKECVAFAKRHGITLRLARSLQCTAEHLVARQDGGRDAPDNIAAVCRVCNHRRHAQRKVAPTPEAYRALVKKRVSKRAWHPPEVFNRGLIARR